MADKILFVDDDPNILEGYERKLQRHYEIETALGPEVGLRHIDEKGPFAVVVADLRMPGMDGIQFLSRVKEQVPDTVRVMLTGNADVSAAIEAVNEGSIFRFLTKPCPTLRLTSVLDAGIEQHRLVISERELLEKTLRGSVKVLTDVLSLINPGAFSRATRIRRYIQHISTALKLPNKWQFELAAMLCQIGCVTVPPEVLSRLGGGQPLSSDEAAMYAGHPAVGARLLENIPRLGITAKMIEDQLKKFCEFPDEKQMSDDERYAATGSQMLLVALDLDQFLTSGKGLSEAIVNMQSRPGKYNPEIVAALAGVRTLDERQYVVKSVYVHNVTMQMTADENIYTRTGVLLIPEGQPITQAVMVRLKNFSRGAGVNEPFRVREYTS